MGIQCILCVQFFSKSNLCGTESKALRSLKKTEHTLCLDSNALKKSCVTACSRAVTVDFPDWNPHCILETQSVLFSLRWMVIT